MSGICDLSRCIPLRADTRAKPVLCGFNAKATLHVLALNTLHSSKPHCACMEALQPYTKKTPGTYYPGNLQIQPSRCTLTTSLMVSTKYIVSKTGAHACCLAPLYIRVQLPVSALVWLSTVNLPLKPGMHLHGCPQLPSGHCDSPLTARLKMTSCWLLVKLSTATSSTNTRAVFKKRLPGPMTDIC